MSAFTLDPNSGVPFYRQIIDQIRMNIASGRLKNGDQLPTVRELSVTLSLNPNTVSKAYRELELQQILQTHPGIGTFISDMKPDITRKDQQMKIKQICDEFITVADSYGISVKDLLNELESRKHHNND